ncbi:MAG TPA: YhbY family RNA-binding protein [Clostridia bacterium]|nr:YhbY family RNA-binding protein [Clostridia bacterium]
MITSKQRSYLRGLSNDMPAIFQIGKSGITPVLVKQVCDALEARELVKINVLKNSGLETREACQAMAQGTGADIISCVGNKFVIYKQSQTNQKIFLD